MGHQASDVTAIDVLLEPDATMLQRAAANNARLLKLYPAGFALDATHRPHITLVQRFVRTDDLDTITAALDRVLARADVTAMKLQAFQYYYLPMAGVGVAGIVARPTPELVELQAEVVAAVAPFTVATGESAAFVTTPDDPVIDPGLIDYVATFVPKRSGALYNPHVTIGVAPTGDLDRMLAEPFESFTFSPAGAAVYQLGPFGTAAKKLAQLDAKP
ncbi:2'-5' RNA ligase superfamily protein [Roseiarcus fermentans]|uniref:2'-5' RNA ligase superfamily protein n=1 Tax=Roseiarcus fermentans TaxID=1473586 RepID=A0A366EJQ1_9HYPH|nr:2'-5' RNA ligase family protein [Roseiarcus fermentans]RBP02564.1 2'-5' RNA ligase superfamily protein [Roseiarcus fermentans]